MTADLWLSLALGGGMGLVYGLASRLSARSAARRRGREFLVRYLGGMMVRIAAVLISLTLVLALVPVRQGVFVTAFLGFVFLGIALEVVTLMRRREDGRDAVG